MATTIGYVMLIVNTIWAIVCGLLAIALIAYPNLFDRIPDRRFLELEGAAIVLLLMEAGVIVMRTDRWEREHRLERELAVGKMEDSDADVSK